MDNKQFLASHLIGKELAAEVMKKAVMVGEKGHIHPIASKSLEPSIAYLPWQCAYCERTNNACVSCGADRETVQ